MPTLFLRAYGWTIALDGPAAALAVAKERLPPTYRIGSAPADRAGVVRRQSETSWIGLVDGQEISIGANIVEVTEAVLSQLELWTAEHAHKRVFVHAGCVTMNRQAILLPGRSMSGKSTLTAALVRAGAEYFSDEYAVLDNQGFVRPYSRMLAIRPYDGAAAQRVPVEEFGGRVGRGPARVKLIAVLRFDPEASWQPNPLTRGPAVLRLLDNTVAARSRPRAALSALEGATLDARALEGTRGDADDAAARLMSILSR